MSKTAAGPWTTPAVDILDGPLARVMKTAAFTRDRRFAVGFVPESGWGGDLLFRELVQLPDGTLGTKFPAEMLPEAGEPTASSGATVRTPEGFGAVAIDGVPQDARITATLSAEAGTSAFGIVMRSEDGLKNGLQLELRPSRRRAAWLPSEARSLEVDPLATLEEVDSLDKPVQLEIVVKGEIFDVSVNRTRTLVYRAPNKGQRMFVFAHNGGVTVSDLVIRPLR
jgi:hypothetical protein